MAQDANVTEDPLVRIVFTFEWNVEEKIVYPYNPNGAGTVLFTSSSGRLDGTQQ